MTTTRRSISSSTGALTSTTSGAAPAFPAAAEPARLWATSTGTVSPTWWWSTGATGSRATWTASSTGVAPRALTPGAEPSCRPWEAWRLPSPTSMGTALPRSSSPTAPGPAAGLPAPRMPPSSIGVRRKGFPSSGDSPCPPPRPPTWPSPTSTGTALPKLSSPTREAAPISAAP